MIKTVKRFNVFSRQANAKESCATLAEAVLVAFAIMLSQSVFDIHITDNLGIEPEYRSVKLFGEIPAIQSVV